AGLRGGRRHQGDGVHGLPGDGRAGGRAPGVVQRRRRPTEAGGGGSHVGAAEALAIGLADQVVPDADVYQAARDLVAQYATGPALALRAAKQAVNKGLEVDLATGLEIERLQFAALFATEDQKTGMRSFLENGPGKAVFEGR